MQPQPTINPAIRALLEQAIGHHRAGRLADAETLYKKVLQAVPQEPDACHNLGLIAMQVGRRDVALTLFQTALAANPLHPQFLASCAHTLLELGRNADALAILRQGLQGGVAGNLGAPTLASLLERAGAAPEPKQPPPEEEAALFQLFKLGLHAEVQRESRRLLEQFPDTGYLWKLLGASLQVEGRDPAAALQALRMAAQLLPHEPDAQNNLAVALLPRGEFAEAAQYARLALQLKPNFVEGLQNLGAALHGLRDFAGAEEQFRYVMMFRAEPATRINLAICLAELGRPEEALQELRRAANEGCDTAPLHCQMGVALQALGKADDAMLAYCRALERDPHLALAHNNLGNILHARHQTDDAMSHYRAAIAAYPQHADAHNNLGVALREQGLHDEALASFNRALAWRSDFAQAHSNLGSLLHEMGRVDEALRHCRKAAELAPDMADVHANLGQVLHMARQYDAALAAFHRALELKPDFAEALSNLGALQREMGRPGQAMQSCLAALQSDPDSLNAHSSLLFTCNYLAHESSAALLEHARRYGAAAEKRARPYQAWRNTPDPARPLRIGLVSADLWQHPVGYFLVDVLAALQREYGAGLAFHAYANSLRHDELSRHLKSNCAAWHSVFGWSDEQLARQIHGDAIDILFDLSGHTTGTRLSMFAWKPAPVQASWLGYFATTGLAAMDYVVADPWTLPLDEEAAFSETVWRLPETRLCLATPRFDIAPSPLPALGAGCLTFGCCNGASKLGDDVIALWARILKALPGSRLLLKNLQFGDEARRADMRSHFSGHGIAAERLLLEGPSAREEYLRSYARIDIALDPFPYPGGTTTAEALWMGVPVLTLEGRSFLARQGAGMLANAGLGDWIAADPHDYLAKAVAAATDLPALARLRGGLRAQVQASPLFDAPRFAAHFETMLRAMWRVWCKRQTNSVADAG